MYAYRHIIYIADIYISGKCPDKKMEMNRYMHIHKKADILRRAICAICAAAALLLLTALAAYRVYDGLAPTHDMGMALGEALTLLFVLTAAAMLLFLPILQTFVVMILRRVGGEKN
jgi:hypothetical protein